jgi:hypothetical protein
MHRRNRLLLQVLVICFLVSLPSAKGKIIYVDDDGPADFNNIQAAIDDANDGDVVLIRPGTFTGDGNRDIYFRGKAITVRSEKGPEATIVDCENGGHGFYIMDNERAVARLQGLTIRNASFGAVKCYSSNPPRLVQSPPASSLGVNLSDLRPGYAPIEISNCIIEGNPYGGILMDGHDNVTVTGCIIARNKGAGVWSYMSFPTFRNCVIVENEEHGLRATGADVANCTIATNGGMGLWVYEGSIVNSILWANRQDQLYNPQGQLDVTYCDIQGGLPGVGNIDAKPCFGDPNSGDYHLKSQAGRWEPKSQGWIRDDVTSPCIDAGNPMSPIGREPFPNGGTINMGAYGGTVEASKSHHGRSVCETIIAGDINGDCKVDSADFMIMAYHWLQDGTREQPHE